MKLYRLISIVSLAFMLAVSMPGFGASQEIVELQAQVQQLTDRMAQMQESFDEHMGVMSDLVEQQTDTVNQMMANAHNLQTALEQQTASGSQRDNQVSKQVQALRDSLDEVKARLAKVSTQLDQLASQGQNTPQPTAATSQVPVPTPDVLYDDALRDYNAGRGDMASQEFGEYLKYYSNAEMAGDAQFYLAEIEYAQGNFAAAAKGYENVLEQYPGGDDMAGAQLKEGMALVQLGQRDAAVREFKAVTQRYPGSVEAATANDQLRKMKGKVPSSVKRSLY